MPGFLFEPITPPDEPEEPEGVAGALALLIEFLIWRLSPTR